MTFFDVTPEPSPSRTDIVRELQELIEALDRRTPQVARAGEASIARDAAALKEKAVRRLAELDAEWQPVPVPRRA